ITTILAVSRNYSKLIPRRSSLSATTLRRTRPAKARRRRAVTHVTPLAALAAYTGTGGREGGSSLGERDFVVADYHPRWGCVIVSSSAMQHEWRPRRDFGPYVHRIPPADDPGPGLAVAARPKDAPPSGSGKTVARSRQVSTKRDRPPAWKDLKYAPSTTPPGVLVSVPAHPRSKITIDPDDFKSPGPNAGTIHPDARVVRITRGKLTLAIAFDAASPKAAVIDRVRLDFTGQGNFVNAPVVVRYEAWSRAPERLTLFRQRPMNIVVGGRKLTIAFECSYGERDRPGTKPLRSAELHIGTAAQGKCRFGNTVREVLVTDGNGNLTLNDPGKPVRSGALENARGDRLRVDIGTGDFKYALYGLYDNPVLVAGRLYDVIVSDDGAKIHAKPYTGKIGYVRIAHPEWRAD
ncbi:hypothetical protein LCGC14_2811520, partial [marine sediment metagenome]